MPILTNNESNADSGNMPIAQNNADSEYIAYNEIKVGFKKQGLNLYWLNLNINIKT